MNSQDGMQSAVDNVNQRLQIAKDRRAVIH